ncbi:hypothetical protein CGLO_08727 [Colletotrichum gloeosporioides Cg-14]|uniref:Uncharacterized protein n=1 Tax=Colletotrichum gloeosporioides (strain Cg-14) TaxID=1237896 RepID=T0KFE9_COLGC|nr:hypothetical protein CGLO_08727 [Colletotrichum gloeosporioides Cg-14]
MLGLSTAWIEGPVIQFGLQHLYGARALVDIMLADSSLPEENPSVFGFTIKSYLYRDMACAFRVPSSEQAPIDNVDTLLAQGYSWALLAFALRDVLAWLGGEVCAFAY